MDISHPLKRARAYLSRYGSPVVRYWTDSLMGDLSSRDTVAQLAIHQRGNGQLIGHGLPAPDLLGETTAALDLLDSLGQQELRIYEDAVQYLIKYQEADGGWLESGIGTENRITLTGEIAGLISKTPFSSRSVLDAAGRYLAAAWSVEFIQHAEIGPIGAYFHFLTNYPDDLADEALQWCGRELERGYRTGRFGPISVSRVYLHCHAYSLPGSKLESSELVQRILALQRDDGSFRDLVCIDALGDTLVAVRFLAQLVKGRGEVTFDSGS